MKISTKPYLVRAIYDWCLDSDLTPYIVAHVDDKTVVPMQHVKEEEIVLNIAQTAVQKLKIDNDWVNFSARFSGSAHEIWVPVGNILSVFARETGEGMAFELEKPASDIDDRPESTQVDALPEESTDSFLKVIK